MKQDVGVSPCLFLVIEVKSEKKGKDVIDSHSMLLRNFFRGKMYLIKSLFWKSWKKVGLEDAERAIFKIRHRFEN